MVESKEHAEVILQLREAHDAFSVASEKYMLHRGEYDRVKELLASSLEGIEEERKNSGCSKTPMERRHGTILLSGSRGSGKTTFMLSMRRLLKSDSVVGGQIVDLGILDPTLIEDKEHVFTNIISRIHHAVTKRRDRASCCAPDSGEQAAYDAWEKSLRRLAEGLPAINGIGADGLSGDAWLDAEFVLQTGIRRAYAANQLEENFHAFVRQSLEYLGGKKKKNAFLLYLDDIDTQFERGWPVLEVLRKYLTTPQLIVVLCGDLELYSTLVRDRQWKNFSTKLLRRDTKRCDEYAESAANLEQQYLLKLLRPDRRVFLDSAYQKETRGVPIHVQVPQSTTKESELSLRDAYGQLFAHIGVKSGGEFELFYRFCASQPIRTQAHVLRLFFEEPVERGEEPVKQGDHFQRGLPDAFWTDLSEGGVDVPQLMNAPRDVVTQAVRYLVNNEALTEGYTFRPVFSSDLRNGAQFAFGALISAQATTDKSLVFDYCVRLALTRELGMIFWDGGEDKRNRTASLDGYLEHCSVLNPGRPSRYVARLAAACTMAHLRASPSFRPPPWHGVIALPGLAERANKSEAESRYRIDRVLKNEGEFTRVLASLPLSGATNHRGYGQPVYSFYTLLGVLGEVVAAARRSWSDEPTGEKPDGGRNNKGVAPWEPVLEQLRKNAQYREYPMPPWRTWKEEAPGDEAPGDEDPWEQPESGASQALPDFAREMAKWARYVKKGEENKEAEWNLHPHVLGKILTRFFYAMNNIDKELRDEHQLGVWMHRMVVAFLHAVVLVDALETPEKTITGASLKLTNPIKKDDVFVANLKKLNDLKLGADKLAFSRWMVACPLWWAYLKSPELSSTKDEASNKNEQTDDLWRELGRYGGGEPAATRSVFTVLTQVWLRAPGDDPDQGSKPQRFSIRNGQHREWVRNVLEERGRKWVADATATTVLSVVKTGLGDRLTHIGERTAKRIQKRFLDGTL